MAKTIKEQLASLKNAKASVMRTNPDGSKVYQVRGKDARGTDIVMNVNSNELGKGGGRGTGVEGLGGAG